MNTTRRTLFLISLFVSSTLFAVPSLAHDLWITMDSYRVAQNKTVSGTVFSSHHLPAPAKDAVAPERMDQCVFVTPGGKSIAAENSGKGVYGSGGPLKQTGTYIAAALPVNGFATKTPDGYQRGKSRKDVETAVYCRYSRKFAKAIFSVGSAGNEAFSKPLGHAMEIIPLKDPTVLKTGDVLPVRVLLEGQPVRTYVFGTYAGFSESANTFAYTTRTDKKGVAEIKMIHDGVWLLIAKQEEAYPDPSECDTQTLAASLTFEIQ